jgi:hypothetical protein
MNRALRLFALAAAILSGVAFLVAVGLLLRTGERGYDAKRLSLGLLCALIVNLYLVWKTRPVSK